MRRWRSHPLIARTMARRGLALLTGAAIALGAPPSCTTSERRAGTPTTVAPPAELARAGLEFTVFTIADDKGILGQTLLEFDAPPASRPADSNAGDFITVFADPASIADWRAAGLRLLSVPASQGQTLLASLPSAGTVRREWIVPSGEWTPLLEEAGSLRRTTLLPIGTDRQESFEPGTFRLLARAWIVPGDPDQHGIIPPSLRVEILPQHMPRREARSTFREALDGLKLESLADRGPTIEPLRLRLDLTNDYAVLIVPENQDAQWSKASPPPASSTPSTPASSPSPSVRPRGPDPRNPALAGPPAAPPRGQPPTPPEPADENQAAPDQSAPIAGPPPPVTLDLGNVMLSDIATRGQPRVKLVLSLRAILPAEYRLLPAAPAQSNPKPDFPPAVRP